MTLNPAQQLFSEHGRPRHLFAVLILMASAMLALPRPLPGQVGQPEVIAFVYGDSVTLEAMHYTTTNAEGLTIAGQAFYSSARDLADGDMAELVITPLEFVGITASPPADSVWVTPFVAGERQSTQVIETGFQAPSAPGRYEFFVSGSWAVHPDGSRPPSGPARHGSWALRLIVR